MRRKKNNKQTNLKSPSPFEIQFEHTRAGPIILGGGGGYCCRHYSKERHQNSGEIPYLYHVKIESVIPPPSIFTGKFHPYMSWHVRREHQLDLYGDFPDPIHHLQAWCEKIIRGIQRPEKAISLFLLAIGHLRQIVGKLKSVMCESESGFGFESGFDRRSANVNLTQLDQNDLPRILLKPVFQCEFLSLRDQMLRAPSPSIFKYIVH